MADENNSSNTAIVAIIVIVLLVLGFLYFFGIFGGPRDAGSHSTTVIEKPTVIENPIKR
jgi:hypothetical protein